MVQKEHNVLMRSIRGYAEVLEQSAKLHTGDFFIEDTYKNENNQSYPCYLLTRKGCDMVANKMTGEKGILFTAEYVTQFEEMENQLKQPVEQLSPMLQVLINMELEQKQIKEQLNQVNHKALEAKAEVQAIREVVALNSTNWRKYTSALISKMALKLGGYEHINILREESYKNLEQRVAVQLNTRLTNKRRRMADEGVCKSKRDKLNKLDVIAEDKKILETYLAVVKEMAIKYGA